MNAWLYGYFGHGNIGDDAIMLSVIDGLARQNQETRILTDNVLATRAITEAACFLTPPLDSQTVGKKYKIGYWLRNGLRIGPRLVGRNACIYACGGSINDHVAGRVEQMQRRIEGLKSLGFRVGMLGAGIDGISTSIDSASAGVIIEDLLDYCSVRDSGSVAILNQLGVKESKFRLAADPVFAMPSVTHTVRNKIPLAEIKIGLNLRPLFRSPKERGDNKHDRYADYVARCRALIDRLTETVGLVKLIPFAPEDHQFLRSLGPFSKVETLPYAPHPTLVMENVAGLDLVIGMRLHAIIFSVIAGVPCVPIPYAPKVASIAEALQIDYRDLIVSDGSFFAEQPLNIDAIEEATRVAWSCAKPYAIHSLEVAAHYRRMAQQDLKDCWQALSAAESGN